MGVSHIMLLLPSRGQPARHALAKA